MSFLDNTENHYKTIKQTCYIANTAYLILRVVYLVLFLIAGLYPLVWIDAASILIYTFFYFLIKKRKYYPYALLCGNEFFAFIIGTTLLIGFHTGFHFYLIGLCVVSFFTSYFPKKKNLKGSVIWAGLSLIIYIVIFVVDNFRDPRFIIDKWLSITLVSINIVVVFLFVVFYLFVFLRYALSLEKKIINESRTDELTEISNRYGLYDYFYQLDNKSSKVLALFDIDYFKAINDDYGHVTGDYILKRVAEITTTILEDEFVCRYGGEEFVVVLKEENNFERLEALRKAIQEEVFEFEGHEHRITVTVGVAHYEKDMTLEKWVELADEKMYFGKKAGKNRTIQ